MAHLLHIDSSIRLDGSVTYRDLGADPIPHLDTRGGLARQIPPDQHTPERAESWRLSQELVSEIKQADTIPLGLPLYNFGAPSSVKAWVDHIVANGLSIDAETQEGLLSARDLIVVAGAAEATLPELLKTAGTTRSCGSPHGVALTGL